MSPRYRGFPEMEKATAQVLRELADAIDAGEARLINYTRETSVYVLPGKEQQVDYTFRVTGWEKS
jgi:predicted component of type VI protein secretion system